MAKEKVIHFVLLPEDGDLIGWLRSLAKRSFNKTVNQILVSESRGKIALIPCSFSSAKVAKEVQCRIVLRDEKAEKFVSSIPYGEVTERLKEILRRHIKANQTRRFAMLCPCLRDKHCFGFTSFYLRRKFGNVIPK